MLRLSIIQEFRRDQVVVTMIDSTRRVVPRVERQIDEAWRRTLTRPGVNLYDGPVCRFESARVDGGLLRVELSRTSYRILVGTNFANPHLADEYGDGVMANSMGVSTGLLTADGFWIMGRRNACVAYYPNRVHPFAGSIELAEHVDLFDNAERELREELRLPAEAISGTTWAGLVEDTALRHPESIFFARTDRTRDEVAGGLDAAEHDGVWSVPNEADAVADAMTGEALTPVARAVLLLGGRHFFGTSWFDGQSARLGVRW